MPKSSLILLLAALLIGGGMSYLLLKSDRSTEGIPVTLPPKFSAEAQRGKQLFQANCARCHGKTGGGTKNGPPLVHVIYEPNHHSDESFFRAAKNGVQAHHWPFGNMPRVNGVTRAEVGDIIGYVRELQIANGIQ